MLKEGIRKDLSHTFFRNLSSITGNWWSPDPLESRFPWQSPYISMDGNPISNTDEEGDNAGNQIVVGFTASSDGNFSVGAEGGLGGNIGNFNGSVGFGLTYYSNMYNTNIGGFELRTSFMIGFDDNNYSLSLGSNNWMGLGSMSEFNQKTGILTYEKGDFRLMYENDGTPMQWLGLGDGNDSYRTNSVSIKKGNFSLNLRMFTGLRNQKSFNEEDKEDAKLEKIKQSPGVEGVFGEYYDYGLVTEYGQKYRMGELTLNYGGIGLGVNSEWVRHFFQNKVAHCLVQPQRQFQMMNDDWKPKLNLSNYFQSQYTIWGR